MTASQKSQMEAVQRRISDGGLLPISSSGSLVVPDVTALPAGPTSRPTSPSRPPVAIPSEEQPRLVAKKKGEGEGEDDVFEDSAARRHTMASAHAVWSGPDVTFTKSPSKFLAYRSSSPLPEPDAKSSKGRPGLDSPNKAPSPIAFSSSALSPRALSQSSSSLMAAAAMRPSDESKGEGMHRSLVSTKPRSGKPLAEKKKSPAKSAPFAPSSLLNLSNLGLDALVVPQIALTPPMALASIVSLNISSNSLSDYSGIDLSSLKHLQELDASWNKFRGPLPSKFVPASVVKLDMSYNELTDLTALLTCTELHTLNVNHNHVKKLAGLPSALDTLDISHNLISSLFALRLLSLSSKITDLRVEGNPVCAPTAGPPPPKAARSSIGKLW